MSLLPLNIGPFNQCIERISCSSFKYSIPEHKKAIVYSDLFSDPFIVNSTTTVDVPVLTISSLISEINEENNWNILRDKIKIKTKVELKTVLLISKLISNFAEWNLNDLKIFVRGIAGEEFNFVKIENSLVGTVEIGFLFFANKEEFRILQNR